MKLLNIQYLVIHCSATQPKMDIGVTEIRKWHTDKGWQDIGYHHVIRRSGIMEVGRPIDEVGSHVKGYNSVSIGICMVGGVDVNNKPEDNFTDQQWISLELIVRDLKTKHPAAKIIGHRDLDPKKACPSFVVSAWLKRAGI